MITGESKAVSKGPGDAVIAGTVSGRSLRVRVTGSRRADRALRHHAAGSRRPSVRLPYAGPADRAAAILFYVAVASGAITSSCRWLAGDKDTPWIRTATVLIIACPHALGLPIPLVIAISTSLGARNGLLVKDRLALERARRSTW